ncbi:hypothetical protein PVK06_005595 [Gossypium arboreum]|uniref:RNase H type-1 domain-containing protein n=1 Tax=Gossypium arboreum TaxID=29729 RepID=A0ABR0QWA2_GOSAR|nr:hypothetical protein PVK06_005595 [Gossypium arboreum]
MGTTDEDTIKINFDASFHQESNTSRACIIARNIEGFVMASCIYPSKNIVMPVMVEAWACLHAVKFGEDLGFRDICVEGESLIVIKGINDAKDDRSHISCSYLKANDVWFTKSNNFRKTPSLAVRRKLIPSNRQFSVCAEYCDGSRGGAIDFAAGFLLGGAIFGTIAYVFAPQQTRQTLNKKISQLNSAIDNVSSRLRGGNNSPTVLAETEPEVEATMFLAAFFRPIAALISATKTICGVFISAAKIAAIDDAAKFCSVFEKKMPLKVMTFSGAFSKNAVRDHDL